jgi:hypothetical protein
LHPFIKWIGVTTDVAKMADSGILMYYFVRSSRMINKMAACISQMQMPGVILLFKKKKKILGCGANRSSCVFSSRRAAKIPVNNHSPEQENSTAFCGRT